MRISVDRIVVTELRDGTFYAEIQMTAGRRGRSWSPPGLPTRSRLAVRATVPIFADEAVLSEAGIDIDDDDEQAKSSSFKEFIDTVTPEDFA